MKLIGTIVVLAMMLGVMPAAVYADGSYYVDTNYIVLSPGETATITLSADNAAGRVDWNSEGTVTAAGSEWLDNDSRTFTVTADSVGTGYINVIPTDIATGAGDVFHGAFNYAWLQGWDVPTCARFSSAVSAIKCTRSGGRAGIPTLETVQKYLDTGKIDYTEIEERVAHYRKGMFNF